MRICFFIVLQAVRQASDAAAREQLEKVFEVLVTDACQSFEDCIRWACLKFQVCPCNCSEQQLCLGCKPVVCVHKSSCCVNWYSSSTAHLPPRKPYHLTPSFVASLEKLILVHDLHVLPLFVVMQCCVQTPLSLTFLQNMCCALKPLSVTFLKNVCCSSSSMSA